MQKKLLLIMSMLSAQVVWCASDDCEEIRRNEEINASNRNHLQELLSRTETMILNTYPDSTHRVRIVTQREMNLLHQAVRAKCDMNYAFYVQYQRALFATRDQQIVSNMQAQLRALESSRIGVMFIKDIGQVYAERLCERIENYFARQDEQSLIDACVAECEQLEQAVPQLEQFHSGLLAIIDLAQMQVSSRGIREIKIVF